MNALVSALAQRYGVEPPEIEIVLRQYMPKDVTDAEFMSCCAMAFEQGLNPIQREIKFDRGPDQAIHTIVLIDGWIKRCNMHEQYDGIDFEDKFVDGRLFSVKATIFRKDRRPTSVTEYLSECARDTENWKTMPARNLRWRTLAQCARVTFGIGGMDADEFAQWQERSRALPQTPRRPAAVSKAQPADDLELPDIPDGSEPVATVETSPETDQRYTDDHFIGSFETALCGARGPSDLDEIWEANSAEISERGLEQRAGDMMDAYRKRHEAVAKKTPAAEPSPAPEADLQMPWETAETAPEKPAPIGDMAATAAVKGLEMRLGNVHNATLVKEVWRNFQNVFAQLGPDAQALATKAKDAALARVKKTLQAAE